MSVLPHASVAVNFQTCSSAPPQPEMVLNNMLLTVTAQLSDAVPEVLHVIKSPVFPAPSHSTVISAGGITSGAIRSG